MAEAGSGASDGDEVTAADAGGADAEEGASDPDDDGDGVTGAGLADGAQATTSKPVTIVAATRESRERI